MPALQGLTGRVLNPAVFFVITRLRLWEPIRHPCKSRVKEKHTWPGALARARASRSRPLARIWCLSAVVPAFAEPDIHLLPWGPRGPSQKIELVFTAGPETVSGEPEESFDFRRSLGQGGTWQSARFRILRFSFRCGFYAAIPASSRTGSKSLCSRSTAMRYATNLRATASVAQLAFPFCRAFSYTKARSGFRLGANFAASTRTRWMCLFRCFEIGVRATLSADRFHLRKARSS
jgi:hypothetical protein